MSKGLNERLLIGNCLETIKTIPDNSIDSIVTDPPYELGFMGKSWDNSGVAYQVSLWQECLRVLKPGGHLLAFGGTRTYHRMAVAIEDAGFEIRDSIHWTYGSGFPKSLDVSKAIDKAAGIEREVVGTRLGGAGNGSVVGLGSPSVMSSEVPITYPATAAAKQWQGWGTALKPSHEPIVLARKPLIGTVAENVLQHSTGGINIDGTRISTTDKWEATGKQSAPSNTLAGGKNGYLNVSVSSTHIQGRFPSNTLLTHNHECQDTCTPNCPVDLLDQQQAEVSRFFHNSQWTPADDITPFIYQAKAGKKERNAGLDELEERLKIGYSYSDEANDPANGMFKDRNTQSKNFHPTVKPIELMRYLIKLITPPNGVVLDPFLGSGTTAVAAILEGFDWKGCEMTEDYIPIIKGRVKWAEKEVKKKAKQEELDLKGDL